jgi:hypothetical protein
MLPSAVNDTMRDMMAQIRDVGDGIRGGTYTMTAPVITGGSINGSAIGATTRSTGAFTTLTSNGATTFTAGTASTSTTTGTAVITGGLGVSGRINAANFDGIVGANTAAAGNFTTLGATGVATFSAGTVSAPAITTTGDTNTGIFFPAADTIAFTEGGVEAMRIDSSGNVGIGTASPTQRLDIVNSSSANTIPLALSNLIGGTDIASTGINFNAHTGNVLFAQVVGGQQTNGTFSDGNLRFLTRGAETVAERMRIDSSGNVGIGTSTNTFRLNVVDASSATRLYVANTNNAAGGAGVYMQVLNGASVVTDNTIRSDNSGNMAFFTGTSSGSERMRIDSSGNVGVGTTTMLGKLNVAGGNVYNTTTAAGATGYYVYNGTTVGTGISTDFSGPFSYYDFRGILSLRDTNASYATRMTIDSGGNVNIGTNTGALRGGGTLNLINTSPGQISYRNDNQAAGRYWFSGVESSNDVFFIYPNAAGGVYMTYGATSWTGNSDERLKNITNEIQSGIEKVCLLRAVNFTWKSDEEQKPQVGLIAQDVQKVLPEAVHEKDDEIGTLGVRYTEVIPLLVASIKELKATVDAQAARIAALESK